MWFYVIAIDVAVRLIVMVIGCVPPTLGQVGGAWPVKPCRHRVLREWDDSGVCFCVSVVMEDSCLCR